MKNKLFRWLTACACVFALVLSLTPAARAADGPASSSNAGAHNYGRWSKPVRSYLFANGQGGVTRVEYINGTIVVEDYDSSFQYQSGRTIPMELSIWGGFHAGKDYNFFIFGQENKGQNNSVEVVRVVKYSKDWQRLDQGSLYGANTYIPFDAGSLRCAEQNGTLYVRTCHEMYASADGLNHQSNMTFSVNESSMELFDGCYTMDMKFKSDTYGYTSHSFNQFILIDQSGRQVSVDHGDAYPRAIVLHASGKDYDLLKFPGNIGDNDTGASVGGFAETSGSYVTAYNYGGSTTAANGSRTVYLAFTSKSGIKTNTVSVSSGAYTPVLAPVDLNGGYVIWINSDNKFCYASYSDGGAVGSVQTVTGMISDCQPISCNGKAVWYATKDSAPYFYTLDSSGLNTYSTSGPSASAPSAGTAPSAAAPAASPPSKTFTDVPSTHWAKSWIDRCVGLNVVQGYPNGTFGPDDPVTGAQFATMLSRLFFSSQLEANSALASTLWYLPAMTAVDNAGVLAGTSRLAGGAGSSWSGSADQNLNRYDMAQMIYNTAVSMGKAPDAASRAQAGSTVSDFSSMPRGYQTAVSGCIAIGAIKGMDNGTFSGGNNMTRAQACTVICRVLDAVGTGGTAGQAGQTGQTAASMTMNPATLELDAGRTGAVKASVTGGGAAKITYTSSDPAVARVNASGAVTAVKAGTATVTASAVVNGRTLTAACTVTVKAVNAQETMTFSDSYKSSKYYTALQAVRLTGDYRQDIINIAASQIGYCESNSENQLDGSYPGSQDYTEYGRALGSSGSAWCSEFASWCIRQANVPTDIVKSSRSASIRNFDAPCYTWSQTSFAGGGYTPQPGDLVLFANNGTSLDADYLSHTGIVTGFSQQDGTVILYTIEGNYGNTVKRGERALTASGGKYSGGMVGCFVAPDYGPSSVVPYAPAPQQAASMKLASETLSLETGKTGSAKAAVTGGSASRITYASSAPAVASVDGNGTVTALKAGTAVITASAQVNGQTITAACAVTVKEAASVSAGGFCDEVVRLVNEERAKEGLSPLGTFDTLTKAAAIRAPELTTLFDHTRPDGTQCFTALQEAGVTGYYTAGENIAAGQATPAAVVESWMNSTGHRANILNKNFTHIGVGYVKGSSGYGHYWVQMFVGTNNAPSGGSSGGSSAAAALTMSAKTLELNAGETGTVRATVTGASPAPTVTYTSSNQNVASVSRSTGEVMAKNAGTAVITASAYVNGKALQDTCTVTVKDLDVDVIMDTHTLELEIGKTGSVTAAVTGVAPAPSVAYTSSDQYTASVDRTSGVITARNAGTATITASVTVNGRVYKDTCTVSVKPGPITVTLEPKTLTLEAGKTGTVKPVYGNLRTTYKPSASYESSDPSVAAVSMNGQITGKSAGTATITVYAEYLGTVYTDTCEVTVTAKETYNPGGSSANPGSTTNPGGSSGTNPGSAGYGSDRMTASEVPANGRVTYYREEWSSGNFREIEVSGSTITFSGRRDDLPNYYNYVVMTGFGSKLDYTPFVSGEEFSISIDIDIAGLSSLYGGDTSRATSYLTGGFCQNYTPGNFNTAGVPFFQNYSSIRLALSEDGGLELQLGGY